MQRDSLPRCVLLLVVWIFRFGAAVFVLGRFFSISLFRECIAIRQKFVGASGTILNTMALSKIDAVGRQSENLGIRQAFSAFFSNLIYLLLTLDVSGKNCSSFVLCYGQ